ncbi:MAG: hypothetical protein QM778_23585 [Myxococcales bacterium]
MQLSGSQSLTRVASLAALAFVAACMGEVGDDGEPLDTAGEQELDTEGQGRQVFGTSQGLTDRQCDPHPNEVGLWVNTNYTGACTLWPIGAYSSVPAVLNDAISSFKVGDGATVKLCANPDFGGGCTRVLIGNRSDLSTEARVENALTINNVTSSVFVGQANNTAVYVAEGPDIWSASMSPLTIGNYNTAGSMGIQNDALSSLMIAGGYGVILYTGNNYTGSSVRFDNPSSSPSTWLSVQLDQGAGAPNVPDNSVSSIKVYRL